MYLVEIFSQYHCNPNPSLLREALRCQQQQHQTLTLHYPWSKGPASLTWEWRGPNISV